MTNLETLLQNLDTEARTYINCASENPITDKIFKLIEIIRVQKEALDVANAQFDEFCQGKYMDYNVDGQANATLREIQDKLAKVEQIAKERE